MKCTQCGSVELINTSELPFGVSGDARLEVSKSNIYICKQCGHLEFFNILYIEKLKEKDRQDKEYIEEVTKIQSELERLDTFSFDETYYLNKIAELKEEISTLERLGEVGKTIRTREDSIKEYGRLIRDKKDPIIENQRIALRNRLAEFNKNHRRNY